MRVGLGVVLFGLEFKMWLISRTVQGLQGWFGVIGLLTLLENLCRRFAFLVFAVEMFCAKAADCAGVREFVWIIPSGSVYVGTDAKCSVQ